MQEGEHLSPLQRFLLEALLDEENKYVFVVRKDKTDEYKIITRDITRRFAYNVFEENGYDVIAVYDLEENLDEQLVAQV